MSEILQTSNLSIGYKGDSLLRNLYLSLGEGTTTAIIGPNGAGKSTLIKTLTRHLKPIEGWIFINGQPLNAFSSTELAKCMSVVGTEPTNAGGLRLFEMVALGRIPYTGKLGWLSENDKLIIDGAIKEVGLSEKKYSFIGELSDGERQKAMIARAIAQDTPLIIMDEPFSFLDVAARLESYELIQSMSRKLNKTILFSTHEISEALKTADFIWLFLHGEIISAPPREIIKNGYLDCLFSNRNVRFNPSDYNFYLDYSL